MKKQPTGWLAGIEHQASPHFDLRPDHVSPELLVMHCISLPVEIFAGCCVDQLFMGELDCTAHPTFHDLHGVRVSSHFLIRRNGRLTQFVDVFQRAWHAGVSHWRDRSNCNDFSIGVELEGTEHGVYTAAQYGALSDLFVQLAALCPELQADAIVGHSDIAPGRKLDPGEGFDWQRVRRDFALAVSPAAGSDEASA